MRASQLQCESGQIIRRRRSTGKIFTRRPTYEKWKALGPKHKCAKLRVRQVGGKRD